MTDDLQEALKDLTKRNLKVVAFVTLDDDLKLSILEYDTNGNANFVSSTVDNIQFYSLLKGNMMRPLGGLNLAKTEDTAKEEPDALTQGTGAKKKGKGLWSYLSKRKKIETLEEQTLKQGETSE